LEDFRTMLARRVEEWNEKLLERGRQEGLLEGETRLVLDLLERKFGSVDARSRKRVASAGHQRLLDWLERIPSATRINDVLGD
jgi:hypothetical protein